jgi:hypothetical protein
MRENRQSDNRAVALAGECARREEPRRKVTSLSWTSRLGRFLATDAPSHQTRHDAIRQVQRYDQTADFDRLLLG